MNPLANDLDHIVAHTPDVWQELRGARLFITGGTGFFGTWLLESFAWANRKLALGAEALVLTRDPLAIAKKSPHLAAESCIRFHQGDVRDFEFPAGEFPLVIHAATPASVRLNREEPSQMLDIIVRGTQRVLQFATRHGTRKLLLTSSGAVYGHQPATMTHIPEEYLGGPDTAISTSAYGEGKRLAELLSAIAARHGGLEAKIARCFAFVGPHLPLDLEYAVGNFVRDGLNGGPIVVHGDGTPYRSYLYAADLAIWLWTILVRGASCRPYNVGSDEDLQIGDLARLVAQACGEPMQITTLKQPQQGRAPERYVPRVTRAREELNLRVWTPLAEAIEKTVAHACREQRPAVRIDSPREGRLAPPRGREAKHHA
jgi:dTDP-glucose 4,6-dehydratase